MGNLENNKQWLIGMGREQMIQLVTELGLKSYNATQILQWIYAKRVRHIDEMTNLSLAVREQLSRDYIVGGFDPIEEQVSIDGTEKVLFPTIKQRTVESVYIPDRERATLCISSQAGCRMGCHFCMTARGGFSHNLTAGEIVGQVLRVKQSTSLTNVVYMGMGEPLDNYDNVKGSLDVLTSQWGLAWSPTRITLSTIGVREGLKRFLDETKVHLAVSMHSPFADERKGLMPSQNKYSIEDTVDLLRGYDFAHQRRLSFEYIMFDGINDTPKHADAILRLLKGITCRMNLIRFHAIPDSPLKPSSEERMTEFRNRITAGGVMTTIRSSRGEDIFAACGMLSEKKRD